MLMTQRRIVLLIVPVCMLLANYVSAMPAGGRANRDEPPKLANVLAVARSPFEPVTLVMPGEPMRLTETAPDAVIEESAVGKTTRSVPLTTVEQERDSTKTVGAEDSLGNESSGSTKSVALERPETTEAPSLETSTDSSTEPESETTTAKVEEPAEKVITDTPTTTEASSSVSQNVDSTSTTPATTTTEKPISSERDLASSISETTPTSTTEFEATRVSLTSTTTTLAPETEVPVASSRPTEPPTTTTERPESTTTLAPSTEAPASSEPTLASTEPPKPTTLATEKPEDTGRRSEEANKASCNHLPTYDSEEVQKVFREETTFKNGTIKGKFTYINFDQRYRLVHYTRLPYGPVKIDLVEELSKTESSASNQSSPVSTSDLPQAVLQLRNILPNSLFGFPFLGPQSSSLSSANGRQSNVPKDPEDKNTYFYSTDSISTPNLLSPSVPVSLLPGQRKLSPPINLPAADTLGESFYENLLVGRGDSPPVESAPRSKSTAPLKHSPSTPYIHEHSYGTAINHEQPQQFQYASHSTDPKHSNIMYSYLQQSQQPPQYRYAPAPMYSYQHSPYYPARVPFAGTFHGDKIKLEPVSIVSYSGSHHQMHQPHSHEHYVAPFMFNQPPSMQADQAADPSRLKLKVKTSKTLNINQDQPIGKSAQLRTQTGSSHANSPAQIHRQHRHRSGKQNQELRTTVNSSPIVYHVLRSPVGRVYSSLPQYNEAHAMAYDHDD